MEEKKTNATKAAGSKKKVEEKMVTIKLPVVNGEEKFTTASCNGRVYQIQRGKAVQVPESLAEIIMNAEHAREDADAYRDARVQKEEEH